uniref:HRF142 protein n=1 Tax=Saccharomyces cerevisiae TaxID=4932 RepID=E9PAE9_YEASX|nr:HRF142 [Saccharomyces cerevisiae]prf//2210407B HRF142 gene [Saccharomyces cerevisiae]
MTFFSPTAGFFLCFGFISIFGSCGASEPSKWILTGLTIAVCLGAIGSMTFLLKAQIKFHSKLMTFLDGPWDKTKFLKPSTVIPLLLTPLTVGNLGSSQFPTKSLSTIHCNFLLDNKVLTKLIRAKSQIWTFLKRKACNIQSY